MFLKLISKSRAMQDQDKKKHKSSIKTMNQSKRNIVKINTKKLRAIYFFRCVNEKLKKILENLKCNCIRAHATKWCKNNSKRKMSIKWYLQMVSWAELKQVHPKREGINIFSQFLMWECTHKKGDEEVA